MSVKTIDVGIEEYKFYSALVNGGNGRRAIGRGKTGGIALAKTYNAFSPAIIIGILRLI